MHYVELDQSGRTEKLNEPSGIAFANGLKASIFIPARDKRAIYSILKARSNRKLTANIHVRVFVAAVFFLIKDHIKNISHITIDREFDGHDADLKTILLRHIWKIDPTFPKENITINSVGKKSPAHELAHKVFQKKQKATREVKATDLLPLI